MTRKRGPIGGDSLMNDAVAKSILELPDEAISRLQFTIPLFNSQPIVDSDGFTAMTTDDLSEFPQLQQECLNKFGNSPQISSYIRDYKGKLTGWGFGFYSKIEAIQHVIDTVMDDQRNDMWINFPKFIARAEIEGELFLMFTVHTDGFVEIDFIDPKNISSGGDNSSGIIFHPVKQTFPMFYCMSYNTREKGSKNEKPKTILVPSINLAYYPELEKDCVDHPDYHKSKLTMSKATGKGSARFKEIGGYYRFIVSWDQGYFTKRNASHIKSTLSWVNQYEELKQYEIDHKKSSGSYLWVISIESIKDFKEWLALTDEERAKTGIMQPKSPGGTLILPPGMKLDVMNPTLPQISDSDTDIMQMIMSGLQTTQDTMMGDYRSTYAAVKAAQGPQSDRTNDELSYFGRYLQFHFWRGILFLKSQVDKKFKLEYTIEETIGFKDGESKTKKLKREAYQLVDISFPVSKLEDIESTAKALLGSKHGSVIDSLGIPRAEVATRLGFPNYPTLRKRKATEDDYYPETITVLEAEMEQADKADGAQEKKESDKSADKSGEPKANGSTKKPTTDKVKKPTTKKKKSPKDDKSKK